MDGDDDRGHGNEMMDGGNGWRCHEGGDASDNDDDTDDDDDGGDGDGDGDGDGEFLAQSRPAFYFFGR